MKGKVLVVDDAGPMVTLCTEALQALGYSVKGAITGEMVLELLRNESFDLVLVDYRMPGMNGFEVFEKARAIRPDQAFVLVTAYGTTDVIDDATGMGFRTVLLKPFTHSQLRAAVEHALGPTG